MLSGVFLSVMTLLSAKNYVFLMLGTSISWRHWWDTTKVIDLTSKSTQTWTESVTLAEEINRSETGPLVPRQEGLQSTMDCQRNSGRQQRTAWHNFLPLTRTRSRRRSGIFQVPRSWNMGPTHPRVLCGVTPSQKDASPLNLSISCRKILVQQRMRLGDDTISQCNYFMGDADVYKFSMYLLGVNPTSKL